MERENVSENSFIYWASIHKLDCASRWSKNGDNVNNTYQQVRFLRPLHDCMNQDEQKLVKIKMYNCVFGVCGKTTGVLNFCGGREEWSWGI